LVQEAKDTLSDEDDDILGIGTGNEDPEDPELAVQKKHFKDMEREHKQDLARLAQTLQKQSSSKKRKRSLLGIFFSRVPNFSLFCLFLSNFPFIFYLRFPVIISSPTRANKN
jgi:hypothetical protein